MKSGWYLSSFALSFADTDPELNIFEEEEDEDDEAMLDNADDACDADDACVKCEEVSEDEDIKDEELETGALIPIKDEIIVS